LFSAFSARSNNVVDVFEEIADQAVDALERRRAHELQQFSDAVGRRRLICLPLLQIDNLADVVGAHPRAPLRRHWAGRCPVGRLA
jgi:hypothetical protein